MIDRIIRFSIQHKLTISFFVIALMAFGIYSATQLPIDAVPDITNNQVQVITTSPSLAAQEVEQLITFPLEMALGNTPGAIEMRSVSRFGLSVITVIFKEEVDTYLARQLINERIQIALDDIPEGLGSPQMGPISTGLGEIYQYIIHPAPGYEDQYTPMELRTIQDWVIKRQLVNVPGVIEVNSIGGYVKQFEIAINPMELRGFNLNLTDLYQAIVRNNANTGGSYIEKDQYAYFIRGEGLITSEKDLENILVKSTPNYPIYLKDVAEIRLGHAPRFGAVTMNGQGEVVAGQVMMLKGENPAEVTRKVKERIELIKMSLPEGVLLEPYLDRTKLVNQTITTVITNLVEGGLIVIFVLVLLLGNLRASLIVASVIPLSMLFALSMMYLFGISANLMSLGAIDFGLIVDGAIIIVEAILFHLALDQRTNLSQGEMDQEVFVAASKTRKAAAFGEIIILIVYLPIFFLYGIEGKMFKPMAQTVSFAITGALILSLTYVPMISSWTLWGQSHQQASRVDKVMDILRQRYLQVLKGAMNMKRALIMGTLILFGGSLWLLSTLGGEFIPTLEEGDLALHQILPAGSSISQGVAISGDLQDILLNEFPEVEKVVTKIGTAEIPTDIMPMEAGDIYVILKPKEEWTSASSREEMFEKMEAALSEFPGVIYEFTQPIQMRFNELMGGIRQDIAIKIFGENMGVLAQKAKEAQQIIQTVDGIGDIQVEVTGGLQQLIIEYDRALIAQYGLNIDMLNRIIRGSFAGDYGGTLYDGEKRYSLVVRLADEYRQDPTQLNQLFVPLPNGQQIYLSELADIRFEEGPVQISRENTQRRITIGVNVRGRDLQSLVNDIEQDLQEKLALPPGYYVTYGGKFENFKAARKRLSVAVPIALFLIFVLLYFTFQSINQALLIFTAIPMSATGGIFALYLRGLPFSISAGVGFIALFGVAVLNGIVLIAYFNRLKEEGEKELMDRIYTGAHARLRPVLMTATVASLGFLPMAISTAPGAEVQQPLATVVIGGLIASTALTLIILPILYYFTERYFSSFGSVFTRRNGKITLIVLPFLLAYHINIGQSSTLNPSADISLENALQKAFDHHPKLKQAALSIQRNQLITQGGISTPKMNLFFSGEENNIETFDGVNSFGFIQSFYLPAAQKATRNLYVAQTELAEVSEELTRREIERQVRKAYYQLAYTQQKAQFITDAVTQYQELERILRTRFEEGEEGKIPLLSIQNKLNLLILQLSESQRETEMSLTAFNYWLISDTLYYASTDSTQFLPTFAIDDSLLHPLLQYDAQQIKLSEARLSVSEKQSHPLLQIGAQIQTVGNDFPFLGYQLGIIFPLFKRAYVAGERAAAVQLLEQEYQYEDQQRQYTQQKTSLLQKILSYRETLTILIRDLLPQAREQLLLSEEAFYQQELPYTAYKESLDQILELELHLLTTKQTLSILHADWTYFRGTNE